MTLKKGLFDARTSLMEPPVILQKLTNRWSLSGGASSIVEPHTNDNAEVGWVTLSVKLGEYTAPGHSELGQDNLR